MNDEQNVESTPVEGQDETQAEGQEVEGQEVQTTVTETAKKAKRPRNEMEKFISVWEEVALGVKSGELTGSGVQLVADRLGIKKTSVSQRATHYRTEYGLELTNMPRGGGTKFDVAAAKAELAAIKAKLAAPKTEDNDETEADAEG